MDKPKTKEELMITALLQRIGEMTMQYENVIASQRVDITQLQRLLDIVNGENIQKIEGETPSA